ncbi:MAG: hypothetical protein ACRD8Z_20590 [Nitrososphaeraceae archaeon]
MKVITKPPSYRITITNSNSDFENGNVRRSIAERYFTKNYIIIKYKIDRLMSIKGFIKI